ncbi:MAG: AlpA family phage regulatory protein [Nautiliaceae bacterium]
MPIQVATKEDVKEAVIEAITPLLQKIEELESKINLGGEAFYNAKKILEVTGYKSIKAIYDLERKGKFPKRAALGRWRKSDVEKWLKNPTK